MVSEFPCCSCCCPCQVEGSAEGLAVLVAAAFAEATSPLPNEARPLKSLLVLCHRLCGPGATVQDESNGRSKGEDADKDRPKKKSKRKAAQEEVSSSSLEPSAAAALWSSALNKAGLESWQSGEELLGELLSWGGSELMSQLQVMGATTFPGKVPYISCNIGEATLNPKPYPGMLPGPSPD